MWTRSVQRSLLKRLRLYSSVEEPEVVGRLKERGLVDRNTRFDPAPLPSSSAVYVGFDPTASSLHTGNLLAIVTLIHFQRHGYQPIAVVGGATGFVGDPSGRSKEREAMSAELLEGNMSGIRENLERIFRNNENASSTDNLKPLKVYNNADWWKDISAVKFSCNIARHFRLVAMLAKDSVKQRLQSSEGMSITEFLYPIFQAYDFLHLHENADCWLQIGGKDQWGNITAGVDFVRRATRDIVHGLTLPLLTSSTGEKLGKSAGNAVWLSPEKTSPYHFYQHFVQTTDQDVERLLKLFTFHRVEEIHELMKEHQQCPEKFGAQKCLAESITQLVHGESGLSRAKKATAALFGDREALMQMTGTELDELFMNAPCVELTLASAVEKRIVEIMHRANIFSSLEEAETMVKKGGLYVNFIRVGSVEDLFHKDRHVLAGNTTVIRIGKKKYSLIKWKH